MIRRQQNETIGISHAVMTTRRSIQYLAVNSSDAVPLSNRRLVAAVVIKLDFNDK